MARVDLRNVGKTFVGKGGPRAAFRMEHLDLEIPDGQVMAILGPSGCGKSTLLRIIAGLLSVDEGGVYFDSREMDEVPPSERRIGMVFQNYALYPNYDSKTNVLSYFMFRKKTPELEAEKAERYQRTVELLGVELEKLLGRMPKGLSGGEQQRVAIARCITRDPRLFLLDEPFSSLDQKLREKYRVQLRVLLKQFNITTVYVTHDQVEALILADVLALMNEGRIEQVGSPQEIYDSPRNLFAADFLNFEPETPAINLIDGGRVSAELAAYTIGARPEHIRVASPEASSEPRDDGAIALRGEVIDTRLMPLRNICVLCLKVAGADLYLRVEPSASYEPGSTIAVRLERYHLFDKESGLRVKSVG